MTAYYSIRLILLTLFEKKAEKCDNKRYIGSIKPTLLGAPVFQE